MLMREIMMQLLFLQDTYVLITNAYEYLIHEMVKGLSFQFSEIVFVGLEVDDYLESELSQLSGNTKVRVFDNSLPINSNDERSVRAREIAEKLSAERSFIFSLYSEYQTPALSEKVEFGSFQKEEALIVMSDGAELDDDKCVFHDYESMLNSLFAVMKGLGINYSGFRTDSQALSHKEHFMMDGITLVELDEMVSETGWLIEGVVRELCDHQYEDHFLHLQSSVMKDLFALMGGVDSVKSDLKIFLDPFNSELFNLGVIADA